MKVRVAIVLGWLSASGLAMAQAPTPPTPAPTLPPPAAPAQPPIPTLAPAPVAAPVPTPAVPVEAAPKADDKKADDKKAEKAPPSPITITLGNVCNTVTPFTKCSAKTEEGKIDVTAENNVLKVVMTGGVGANVFLGGDSIATQNFQLVQEFEVGSTDDKIKEVTLAVDAGLVGFVRSKHKASACVHQACVTVYALGYPGAPIILTPNRLCVMGPNDQHCGGALSAINKDPLPTATSGTLPLGQYIVKADLFIQATASGWLDSHSTAIFSPEPKELDPWEREHDPLKGEDKAGYGFSTIITATPAGAAPVANAWKKHLTAEKKKALKRIAEKESKRLAAGQPGVVR